MNIFWHELKTYRMPTLVWAISLGLLVILFLSFFPAFHSDVQASMKLLSNLPLAIREALGISLHNFFTIFGFYSYLLTFVTLAGAVQAMNIGLGIVAKEISGKTVDFLLTKPVSRSSVLTQKIAAGFATIIFTNIVFVITAFVTANVVSPETFSSKTFILLSFTLFLIQLAFFTLGILIATFANRIKSIIAFSLPITFSFFIIGSLGAIIGNTTVRYITPFKFYDPIYIISHNSYELKYALIEIIFVLAAIAISFVMFNKKEIDTV